MTSGPHQSLDGRRRLTQRLWVVRGAAITTLALLCLPSPPWEWLEDPALLLLVLPLAVPFLMILWRLRRGPRKDGLALATGVGGILFVGAALLLLITVDSSRTSWSTVAFLAPFTAVQMVLAGGGAATYTLLGYAKGDWKRLTRGVVDPLVYFGVIAVLFAGSSPFLAERRARRLPTEAVAWMKRLHGCATAYAASHRAHGFPATLDLLGPQGTGCLEPLSAESERSGYVFTYRPTAPEAGGRLPGYAVAARPVNRVRPNQQSFFMDSTGRIHATTEERDATPQDPMTPQYFGSQYR